MGNCCSSCRDTSGTRRSDDYMIIKKSELSKLIDEKMTQHAEQINGRLEKLEASLYGEIRKWHASSPEVDTAYTRTEHDSGLSALEEHWNYGATLEEALNEDSENEEARDVVIESVIKPVNINNLRRQFSDEALKNKVYKPRLVDSVHSENSQQNNMKLDFVKLDSHVYSQIKVSEITKRVEDIVSELIGPGALYVGSAYEDILVGQPYEFDIQWLIEEELRVEYTIDSIFLYDAFEVKITPEIVKKRQKEILISKLKNLNLPPNWKLFGNDVESSIFSHRKGFQVGFILTDNDDSNVDSKNESVGILLDLIPCHVIPVAIIKEHSLLNSDQLDKLKSFMSKAMGLHWDVEEGCLHAVFDGRESWKISTSVIERTFLSLVPDHCKQPYRVLKYFLRTYITDNTGPFTSPEGHNQGHMSKILFGLDNLLHSYCLKNEFLKLLIRDIDFNNNKYPIQSHNIAGRLLDELMSIYPKNGTQRMKKKRHFLLSKQEVDIMEINSHRQEISNKLQDIKKYMMECGITEVGKYPLLNYLKQRLPMLKPMDLPPKPKLLRD